MTRSLRVTEKRKAKRSDSHLQMVTGNCWGIGMEILRMKVKSRRMEKHLHLDSRSETLTMTETDWLKD